jgi:hypothetical protein
MTRGLTDQGRAELSPDVADENDGETVDSSVQ